jgi:glycosyltransferase involved in cell wall biosynthesis
VTTASRGPKVTVVVPTRNRLPLLQEAIDSVERQRISAWEAVVVDDASEDGTAAWLEAQPDLRIRPVRLDQHSERSAARNRGLDEANGDFVLFLDDDDRLLPGSLERLSRALERRPGAVAAVGAAVRFDPSGGRERATHPRFAFTRTVWPDVLAGWDSGSGQALFRTERLRAAGGWNAGLSYWELGDLWFRVARLGPVTFLPATVLELRLHPGQTPPNPPTRDPRPDFLRALPPGDRDLGARLIRAREFVHAGDDARFRGEHRVALANYLRAVRTAPRLIRSPLTRRDLGGNMATETARLLARKRGRRAVAHVRGAFRRR